MGFVCTGSENGCMIKRRLYDKAKFAYRHGGRSGLRCDVWSVYDDSLWLVYSRQIPCTMWCKYMYIFI